MSTEVLMIPLGFCIAALVIGGSCLATHIRDKRLEEQRRKEELGIGGKQ